MNVLKRPRLMVAAPRKSSGKTMVALGLGAALRQRGLQVQPFKKGPDFIDPMWLSAACGRQCRNLDFYLMSRTGLQQHFARHGQGADLCLVEGNMGLFDGLAADGQDSGAALAELLDLPVLLVVDCHGMARSVAPLVWGHVNFPGQNLSMAGVVLNNLSSSRQEHKVRQSLAQCCPELAVLGAISRDQAFAIQERHLGLVPPTEPDAVEEEIHTIACLMEKSLDLEAILRKADRGVPADNLTLSETEKAGMIFTPSAAGEERQASALHTMPGLRQDGPKVAIATDRAFHFYYPENLEALSAQGVSWVSCNLLEDRRLPQVDGLFIGGGFPEVFMERLAANHALLAWVRDAARDGLPIYAECGGLMYLARSILWQGREEAMAGVLPFSVTMQRRPVGYGYMEIEGSGALAWPGAGQQVRCHEFHYSAVAEAEARELTYAYRVRRGHGVNGQQDGVIHGRVLASYAHMYAPAAPGWAAFLTRFWQGETIGASKS